MTGRCSTLNIRKIIAIGIACAAAVGLSVTSYISNMPRKALKRAQQQVASGDAASASSAYDEAYRLGAEMTSADLIASARSYAAVGRSADASAAYERFLGAASADAAIEGELGRFYASVGRSADAVPHLSAAAETASADAATLVALGKIYEAGSDDARAADAYARLTSAEEPDAEALLEAGRYLMKSARYADALEIFQRAEPMMASDDKRAFHAANAAKSMLGWPTNDELVIVPGRAIGSLEIGMSREEAEKAWGAPIYKVDEDGYSVWGYAIAGGKIPEVVVFFDADGVIEMATESQLHATSDGLGLANFRNIKYRDRFTKERDPNVDIQKYTLKGGGLSFYVGDPTSKDRARAVIFSGRAPLTEHIGASWIFFWD